MAEESSLPTVQAAAIQPPPLPGRAHGQPLTKRIKLIAYGLFAAMCLCGLLWFPYFLYTCTIPGPEWADVEFSEHVPPHAFFFQIHGFAWLSVIFILFPRSYKFFSSFPGVPPHLMNCIFFICSALFLMLSVGLIYNVIESAFPNHPETAYLLIGLPTWLWVLAIWLTAIKVAVLDLRVCILKLGIRERNT